MNVFTFNRITIAAGQCALEYRDGTLARVLRPGRHRLPAKAVVVRVEVLEVFVKDVIVPAEIRAAAMQLVTANARGAAQLRLIQHVPDGSRVVLALGDHAPTDVASDPD